MTLQSSDTTGYALKAPPFKQPQAPVKPMGVRAKAPYVTDTNKIAPLEQKQTLPVIAQNTASKPAVTPPVQVPSNNVMPSNLTGSYTNPTNVRQQSMGAANDQQRENMSAPVGSLGYDAARNLAPGTSSQPGYNAPQTPTYGGLIQQLANQQTSPYNVSATGSIGALQTAAQGNQQYADRARQIAEAAGQKISDIGGLGARGEAGYLTTGTSPVAEGNAAILAQTTAAQQRAVAEGANMQLAGNQQGLTAQGQMQSGLGSAAGQALTGQGQAQGALGAAAGYISPVTQAGMLTNPITGQPLNPDLVANAVKQASQLVSNNVSPNDPTVQSLLAPFGFYGASALVAAQQALTGGTYNPNVLNAQAGATASNIGTNAAILNTIDSGSQALNAGISQLKDFAKQGGLDENVPILSALRQKFGTSFANNPAAAGILAKVNSINAQYEQLTGIPGIIDPERVTTSGLDTVATTMQSDVANKRQNVSSQQASQSGGTIKNTTPTSGGSGYKNGGAF